MSAPPSVFRIVVVCTGNQCRSPAVEGFLHLLAGERPVTVSSVGTLGTEGVQAAPATVAAARVLGADLERHRSRGLAAADLAGADLVIGFERAHVAAAVVDGGAPYEKTFTLPELVGLLDEIDVARGPDPPGRARAAISAAHALRERRGFVSAEEIPDPIGRPDAIHEDTARRLFELSERLVAVLFGQEPR